MYIEVTSLLCYSAKLFFSSKVFPFRGHNGALRVSVVCVTPNSSWVELGCENDSDIDSKKVDR